MQQARRSNVLFIVLLGVLTAFAPMSIDLYLPSLPVLAKALDTSAASAQYTLSLFFLGLAMGQLIYGPTSDRVGRRPVLMFGITLYLGASIACALAPGIKWLIVGRLVQGFGAAAGPVVARAAVRDVYAGPRAARVMSFVILVMAMAPLVAPALGGQILAFTGWRGVFWFLVGFSILCLGLTIRVLEETNGPERRAGRSLATLFGAYLKLLRERHAVAYLLCGGSIFGGLFAYVTGASFVYIDVFGVDPQWFGLYFALNVVGLVLGNLFNGQLVMRFGYRRLLGYGVGVSLSGGLALLAVALSDPASLVYVAIPLFFAVGSIGIVGANTVAGLLDIFPQNAGAASALFGVVQFLMGAIGGGLVGALPFGAVTSMATVMAGGSSLGMIAFLYLRSIDMAAGAASQGTTD